MGIKRWIAAVGAVLVMAFGLFGVFVMGKATLDDLVRFEGTVQSAEMWYGPDQPNPIGPARTRAGTPHLWITLEDDSAYFRLVTANNRDKEIQAQLNPGDQVVLYFDHDESEGAYPVRQLERDGEVLYGLDEDNSGNETMGWVIFGVGAVALLLVLWPVLRRTSTADSGDTA